MEILLFRLVSPANETPVSKLMPLLYGYGRTKKRSSIDLLTRWAPFEWLKPTLSEVRSFANPLIGIFILISHIWIPEWS
ncbi:hypothetical protein BHE74_00043780, partial [Ensete ventricosum]